MEIVLFMKRRFNNLKHDMYDSEDQGRMSDVNSP